MESPTKPSKTILESEKMWLHFLLAMENPSNSSKLFLLFHKFFLSTMHIPRTIVSNTQKFPFVTLNDRKPLEVVETVPWNAQRKKWCWTICWSSRFCLGFTQGFQCKVSHLGVSHHQTPKEESQSEVKVHKRFEKVGNNTGHYVYQLAQGHLRILLGTSSAIFYGKCFRDCFPLYHVYSHIYTEVLSFLRMHHKLVDP